MAELPLHEEAPCTTKLARLASGRRITGSELRLISPTAGLAAVAIICCTRVRLRLRDRKRHHLCGYRMHTRPFDSQKTLIAQAAPF